ncbi:TlpA family protein disulfide reductase [Gramella sp. GC03-9]|uniref:TlpA family protein disulfide reductase n=1 Tax=Christiangramia oceanisediminis TaxID=2920386 RepID=A0A9X2IA15_9FLAO|nr:TlpA disulfide reductase family protein [Gramella oceanisediminis]MCP9199972.1 TlpA family protein disulfide reductase [Gramella oceanisediminis]
MFKITFLNKIPVLIASCCLPVFFYACKDQDTRTAEETRHSSVSPVEGSEKWPEPNTRLEGIPVYEKFEDLEPVFNFTNDTTYVINFWATWCKPCIKELPYFEEIDSAYKDRKLKVVLVSLDFPDQVETKLVPFVQERNLNSKVVVLLDGKYNDWIDRVSPEWSGAIPATYIYNKNQNKLIGTSFENSSEIKKELNAFL